MRDFAKVGTGFWTSTAMQQLSDDGKLLALYLITCPHSNSAGTYRLPDGYVLADLGWTTQRIAKGFDELSQKGFASRCGTTFWVVIHKHFQHNQIENPNQAKHVLKLLEQVPLSCTLIDLIRNGIEENEEAFPEGWAERFLNGLERVTEQKRERREEREGEKSRAGKPACPHQKLIDLYHEVLKTNPRVIEWNDERQGYMRSRWNEWLAKAKYSTEEEGLAFWRRYFEHVAKSRFLTGQADAKPGHPPFVASLEWLVRPRNVAKIVEGAYHREAA